MPAFHTTFAAVCAAYPSSVEPVLVPVGPLCPTIPKWHATTLKLAQLAARLPTSAGEAGRHRAEAANRRPFRVGADARARGPRLSRSNAVLRVGPFVHSCFDGDRQGLLMLPQNWLACGACNHIAVENRPNLDDDFRCVQCGSREQRDPYVRGADWDPRFLELTREAAFERCEDILTCSRCGHRGHQNWTALMAFTCAKCRCLEPESRVVLRAHIERIDIWKAFEQDLRLIGWKGIRDRKTAALAVAKELEARKRGKELSERRRSAQSFPGTGNRNVTSEVATAVGSFSVGCLLFIGLMLGGLILASYLALGAQSIGGFLIAGFVVLGVVGLVFGLDRFGRRVDRDRGDDVVD